MISNRPMVPMLTHVDNLGDLNIDMSTQEQSLETIVNNTSVANNHLVKIKDNNDTILQQLADNIAPTGFEIRSIIGNPADGDTEPTVIGLLKSISNKL